MPTDRLQTLSVWCYRATNWAANHLGAVGRFAKAVNTGCWLGVLRNEQLSRLNTLFYQGGSAYGDTPYANDAFNAAGLTKRELEAVQRHFARHGAVLVAGAGGGREVLALTRLGFDVDGFDCNAALVEYGNAFLGARGCPARIELTEPDTCPGGSKRYDAILIGWGVYIHIIPSQRRQAFLGDVRRRLAGGGVVLVGFCRRDEGSTYFRTVAGVANGIRRSMGRLPLERGDKLEPTFEHHFTVAEIKSELAGVGLETRYVDDTDAGRALVLAVVDGRSADSPVVPATQAERHSGWKEPARGVQPLA
jgi:hypothetical protein